MSRFLTTYVVNNISLPIHASSKEAFSVAVKKFASVGIKTDLDEVFLYRRSIDARRRSDIKFVYSVACASEVRVPSERLVACGITKSNYSAPEKPLGDTLIDGRVVVVGAGPAGIFAALVLAESGFKVTLIEKGGTVVERKRAVSEFIATRKLDLNTNIQFGAGGAGTFSDGKLICRLNDSLSTYILERFVEFGAPKEILYLSKPHIGTDVLSVVVDRMLSRINELGSEVLYHTELLDYTESSGRITEIITNNGAIPCAALILAIGHSSRTTYEQLIRRGLDIEAKSFSVGMRIEHKRETIERGLYGDLAGDPVLPPAEYSLSHNTKVRGVYTFCMCPGGDVVAATSEEFGVVVNGMSEHSRSGRNSNSAVCCSIFKEDYGGTPTAAIDFQRKIERAAFVAGGCDYSAPIVTVGDFIKRKCTDLPSEVSPTYMNGGVKLARPELYLPEFVTEAIRGALGAFDKKLPVFASSTAVLTGAETRTSAPIRILRDDTTRLANGYTNFYPCGEGAGYAGGITSAAIDGVKCALALMKKYKP